MSPDTAGMLFPDAGRPARRAVVVRLRLPGTVQAGDLQYFAEAVQRLASAAGLENTVIAIQPEAKLTLTAQGILAAVAEAERLADGQLVVDSAEGTG